MGRRCQTTLSKLGFEATARLRRHDYAVTAMNLHTCSSTCPWWTYPGWTSFVSLVRTEPGREKSTNSSQGLRPVAS